MRTANEYYLLTKSYSECTMSSHGGQCHLEAGSDGVKRSTCVSRIHCKLKIMTCRQRVIPSLNLNV